jgi:DNA helicase-2/ATP-dependent DNA helicase PcrA
MQAEIAGFKRGVLIVEGSPGTGKSTALDERVQRIAAGGTDPSKVAVITSTALSAESHLAELERRLPGPYEEIVAGTWETFAERVLRAWPVEAGLDPDFCVVGRAERLAMLLVRFDELPLRHHEIRGDPTGLTRRLISGIDQEKQLGPTGSGGDLTGRPFADDPLLRKGFEDLVEFHDRMLAGLGCLDRADLCRIAGDLLGGNGSVAEDVAARHPHLVIDELEDLTPVRAGLLAPLARRATSVVGRACRRRTGYVWIRSGA